MAPWTARITEPPLRVPHYTASRGAVAGSRGRPGEVNLAHNGVLVIDQPTEFERDAADALIAVAEDGQTVIVPLHPGRPHNPDAGPLPPHGNDPARRARQPVPPRRGPARSLRHRDHRQPSRPTPRRPPNGYRPSRERVARAAAILNGAPARLIGGRAAQLAPSRRIRAVAQTVAALDGRRQIESGDLAEAERLLYRGDRR